MNTDMLEERMGTLERRQFNLEVDLTKMEKHITTKIQELSDDMKTGIKEDVEYHKRLDHDIDERFKQVDQRFEQVDQRFKQVDQRFEKLERLVDARFKSFQSVVDFRFKQVDEHFKKLEERMDARFEKVDQRFEKVETRFDRMETLLAQILERLPK